MKTIVLSLLIICGTQTYGQRLYEGFEMPTPINYASVTEIAIDADNKILMSGNLDFYEDDRVGSLIRLNVDGTLDSGFVFSRDILIRHIKFLSDGGLVALTTDSLYVISNTGQVLNSIKTGVSTGLSNIEVKDDFIFLVANGLGLKKYDDNLTLVSTFNNSNLFENGAISGLALQNDKILVSGAFNSVNGTPANNIARFDSDGIHLAWI